MDPTTMDPTFDELLRNHTSDVNTTVLPGGPSYQVNIFFVIFFPILIIVTTALNLATIVAFWKLPTLRDKPSELLILNLSCADLITGAILLPLISPLYMVKGYWPLGENGCRMVLLFLNMGVNGSLYALVTISLDRFLLVYMEFPRYMKRVTRKTVYKVIALGWILSFCTVLCELGLWGTSKRADQSAKVINYKKFCLSPSRRVQSYALVYFPVVYFFPVILVCALSAGFFYHLLKRVKGRTGNRRPRPTSSAAERPTSTTAMDSTARQQPRVESTTTDQDSKDQKDLAVAAGDGRSTCGVDSNDNARQISVQRHQTINRYMKPGITLVFLVIAMALCMLPYCIYVIIIEVGCEHCNNTDVLFGLLLLQLCNACLDPFIYALTRRKIRNYYISCCSWPCLGRSYQL